MSKSIRLPAPIAAIQSDLDLWDEIMLLAEKHNIDVELISIFTANLPEGVDMCDILRGHAAELALLKRLKDLDDLLESSANGFNEISAKLKKRPSLEGESKEIIEKIKKLANQINVESVAGRKLRHKKRMLELKSHGLTEREASEKIAAEDQAAGRKPITAETIRRNYQE